MSLSLLFLFAYHRWLVDWRRATAELDNQPSNYVCSCLPAVARSISSATDKRFIGSSQAPCVMDSIRFESTQSTRIVSTSKNLNLGGNRRDNQVVFLSIGIWPRQFPLSIESLLLCRSSSSFGRWSTHRFAHLCEPSLRVRPPWNYPCVNTGYPGPPNRPVWTPGLVY